MYCMKCGKEIEADQVFCEECRAEMEKYPVKPNTLVQIPNRPKKHAAKKVHSRWESPEEQIAALKKRIRRLIATLILMFLLSLGLAAVVGVTVYEMDMHRFLGQNYHTMDEEQDSAGPR